MKKSNILVLAGELQESQENLSQIEATYKHYQPYFNQTDKRDLRDAVMLAEILANSYTCIETALFRIARTFENHLDPQYWHKELLNKMKIDVPQMRKAILSEESYNLLNELRRFRHFKRYYYDFDYDWNRLAYLQSVYERLVPLIHSELTAYTTYLLTYAEALGPETDV